MKPKSILLIILFVPLLFLGALYSHLRAEVDADGAPMSEGVCNNDDDTPEEDGCDDDCEDEDEEENQASDDTGDDEDTEGQESCGGSFVKNGSLRYAMSATDYSFAGATSAGCAPCGSSSAGPSLLPSLSLERNTFISVTETFPSFGDRSGFSKYDDVIVFPRNKQTVVFKSPGEQSIQSTELVYNAASSMWERVSPVGATFSGIALYNKNGVQITNPAQRNSAFTAMLLDYNGNTRHFEVIWHRRNHGAARLVSLMDRYGNEEVIKYVQAQPTGKVRDMSTRFRKKSITDAYNRTMTIQTKKQAGNWVVSKIILPALPGEEADEIVYTYNNKGILGNPVINTVTHPDGSVSRWSIQRDAATGLQHLSVYEPHADRGKRRKTIIMQGNNAVNAAGNIVSSRPRLTRMVENGAGETTYANNKPAGSPYRFVYEGGLKTRGVAIGGSAGMTENVFVATEGASAQFFSADTSTWQLRRTREQVNSAKRLPESTTDAFGRQRFFTRDPINNSVLAEVLKDGYNRSLTINHFNQRLLVIDALGRRTLNVYDELGNLRSRTRGEGTADATTNTYIYNERGQLREERDTLYDENFPELHNTEYVYDTTTGYLLEKIESADVAGGERPITKYINDELGRVEEIIDPEGRSTEFKYDFYNRLYRTTYNDTSTDEVIYGEPGGGRENLVVSRINRNGIETKYEYDDADRRERTIIAPDSPEQSVEECSYLIGTNLKETCTLNGDLKTYLFDHRNRVYGTVVQADSQTELTTESELDVLSRRRSTKDAYGRRTFYLFDQNDRIIKTVRENFPDVLQAPDLSEDPSQTSVPHIYTYTDKDGNELRTVGTHQVTYTCERDIWLQALQRQTQTNANYIITESIYDSEGQRLVSIDGNGNVDWTEYDKLGRVTLIIQSVGSDAEIRIQNIYDSNSNLIEMRNPRYFAEKNDDDTPFNDRNTYTYNGRNLKASHTAAPGSSIEATQSWTYYLDGRNESHTDFRGNTATTLWHQCCGRLQASIQRDGTSATISNTDFYGNVTHTAVVKDFDLDPSVDGADEFHNPVDAETLAETTTRFDGRNRPIATTKWLVARGEIIDHARTNLDTGDIPVADDSIQGLTTSYSYDEDLTDGEGIDADYAAQFVELTARYGYNPFAEGANGFATKVTNPEGESSVQVQDGAGRTIMTINAEGHIRTMDYDTMVAATDITSPSTDVVIDGSLLATKATDANGNNRIGYTDGNGRTLASEDGIGNFTVAAFDNNRNAIITRDANGLGQNCVFDALDRDTACADLQEQAENTNRIKVYNAASQIVKSIDAEEISATTKFDERGRPIETTDRNNLTTKYTYDENNNRLTLTDPRNNTRTWEYDERNLNTKKLYPDGESDRILYEHDALGRITKKSQQDNSEIRYFFDLANRMTSRDYFNAGESAPESTDTFTYDAASRLLTTHKGRYDIATAHTYAADGQPLTETLTIDGRDYTMSRTYDPANRVKTHTFADGKVKEWSYDERNVVTTVTYDGDTVLSKSTDAGYRCTSETFGNGLVRSISFGRQDNLRINDKVIGIDELNFDYTYAADKNVKSEINPSGMFTPLSFNVTYDDGNRVKTWNRVADYLDARETQSWNYDATGNWSATTIDGDTQNRTNNTSDELTNISGNALSYDSRGNLLEDQDSQKYTWDIDNRIANIEPSDGSDEISLKYDAFSRRVHREFGNTDEVLLWWGKEEYAEHENIGSQPIIQNDLHAGPTGLNTTFGRALEGSKHDIQYFHKNYLDHVYAVSDDRGDIIEYYRYTAFGEPEFYNESGEQLAGSAIDNDILWNVKRYSEASGLYMYLYRHYEAKHGRWISRDPIFDRSFVQVVSGQGLIDQLTELAEGHFVEDSYGFTGNQAISRTDMYGLIILPTICCCFASDET